MSATRRPDSGSGSPSGDDFSRRLRAFLDGAPDLAGARATRLVRDAGERAYYRIEPPGGGAEPVVAQVMARPFDRSELPFLNSTALYAELGIPTPGIRREAPELGILLLDDLGDDLLQAVAFAGEPKRTAAAWEEAVDALARIQREGARLLRSGDAAGRFLAFRMRLDEELFLRELRFFAEHFLGIAGSEGRRFAELETLAGALAVEAASGPEALCHRDYHSRNLIWRRPPGASSARLYVIDHQDTRLGPRGYDLVSLLRDPYVAPAPPDDRGAVAGPSPEMPFDAGRLVARLAEALGWSDSADALAEELDAVGLQRNLKALGTYGFQVARGGNPVYRRFIAPTLAMVRDNLARNDHRKDRRRLAELLGDRL